MKNVIVPFTIIIVFSLTTFNHSFSQNVSVSGAVSGNGSYPTLAAAFNALNGGAQTNAIVNILIIGNTTEPVAGAVLNNGSWNSILIQPSGGLQRTISSAVTPGLPLIDFNGADKVKIDGLNSGGNSLIISNTTAASILGTSTVRFQRDATFNVITNCTVLGSSTVSFGQHGGVIIFGTSPSMVTGNDNNTISFCNVGPAGSNIPTKCFGFFGSTNFTSLYNSSDTIRNCNIYDYFNPYFRSAGIQIDVGNKDITIKDNKFYQTSPRTQIVGTDHSAIFISSALHNASHNFVISGNTIGFASALGTGSYDFNGVTFSKFTGIYISADTIVASSIQGNTIAGISMSGNLSGTGNNAVFKGIFVDNSLANVGNIIGNTIGSQNSTTGISINSVSTSSCEVIGIYNSGINNWVCANNRLGNISCFASLDLTINGIAANMPSTRTFTCQNNVIGGSIQNSIQNFNSSPGAIVNGILVNGPRGIIIGNTIRNLSSAGQTRFNSVSLNGIVINAPSAVQTISQNTIHTLRNTNTSLPGIVNGISFTGSSGTNLISRNFIHSLLASFSTSAVNGIIAKSGNATYQNNMIRLGVDEDGNSMNIGATINGIDESAGTNNFYFNSVYLGGNPVNGNSNTFAFTSSVTGNVRNYRNNIFYNSRSNDGSTGKHYAVKVGGTSPNPTGLLLNNNNYFTDGNGGVIGLFNDTDRVSLSAWKTAVGQDTNSFSADPHYIEPNGSSSTVNLHINSIFPTIISSSGFNIVSVTDDFDGQSRSSLTPVDIGADAANFPPLFSSDMRILNSAFNNQIVLVGNTYDVIATAANVGTLVQDSVPIYYRINGGLPIGPLRAIGPFPQLGTGSVVFGGASSFTPSLIGINTLKIYTALSADEYRVNDTLTVLVNVQQKISSFPYVETFSNLVNWSVVFENPLFDTPLWELGKCTSPAGKFSDTAASSNCYLGAPGRREILMSPEMNFSSLTLPNLSFYVSYSGYPNLDDSLEVLLSTNSGISFFSTATVYNKSQRTSPSLATRPTRFTEFFPDSSKQWRHEQISLSNVAGNTSVIIGFRSKSDFGNRQWIDNVIVSEAESFTSQTILSPGVYSFGNISLDMNSVGLNIPGSTNQTNRHSGIIKLPPEKSHIVGTMQNRIGDVSIISNNISENPSGGKLCVVTYPFQNTVPSVAANEISSNDNLTGATTGDSSRFTPNKIIPDVYFTGSYSGNDYLGYANYDISIDVSGMTSIPDINKAYIMKRTDLTAPWVCQNTNVSGNNLITSGLDNFSDFSIGIESPITPGITLNLMMFIEGFYNSTTNTQVTDTIKVNLRDSGTPFGVVDSAKAILATNGTSELIFSNATSGTYFIIIKHRNTVETWSKNAVAFTTGSLSSYNFTTSNTQAFGNNMLQVDASPVRYAVYGGDINQDGFVDLTDITLVYNDANSFVAGYKATDVTGDNLIDLTDILLTYNNNTAFVSVKKP